MRRLICGGTHDELHKPECFEEVARPKVGDTIEVLIGEPDHWRIAKVDLTDERGFIWRSLTGGSGGALLWEETWPGWRWPSDVTNSAGGSEPGGGR